MCPLDTRCTYLGAACKTLARKLWVGSWKSYGQARAAKRKTKAIAARFVLRFVDRALSANELLRSRRLAACGRQVVLRSSAESQQRRRSNEKSTQHRPQIDQNSTKNQRKIGFWPFWAIRVTTETLQGAAGTPHGYQKARLGRPKNALGTAPGRPRAHLERSERLQNVAGAYRVASGALSVTARCSDPVFRRQRIDFASMSL